jgi:DHA2 family metal-tetracycline-proton antiporter-like MFS transporter
MAPRHQKKFLLMLSVVTIIGGINSTGFNVAIPAIAGDFTLTPSEVSWVVSAYVIIFAIGSITYGKLADIYPVKNLMTIALILFCAGSVMGFLSQNYVLLIVARMIQASGAAAIPALEMLTAIRYFPKKQKGRVLGVVAFAISFGWGVGPIVGGFIAGIFNWRFIFLTSLLTAITIPFIRRWLPTETRSSSAFDSKGAILLGTSVGTLLLIISQSLVWLLPVSAVLFLMLWMHLSKVRDPFINLSLFQSRKYRDGLISLFLAVMTVFGMLFVVPLMLEDIYGLQTMKIGLIMFPGSIVGAMFGMIAGRWADRFGSVMMVYISVFCLGAGFALLSIFAGASLLIIMICLIFPYLGFVFMQSALPGAVLASLPEDESGVGVGVYNLVFFMAGAFGSAVVGKMLEFAVFNISINPLFLGEQALIYSNVFFVFILVEAAVFTIFFAAYQKQAR